eukprot:COSAG02_NODE_45683_length_355_cov_0.578125_1_plen_96_part_00
MSHLGPVAPNQLNYSDVLPLAIESKSQKRTFNPTNGVKFSPTGTNVIRLNINSDNLWDCTHSYLQIKFTNTTPATGAGANDNFFQAEDGIRDNER